MIDLRIVLSRISNRGAFLLRIHRDAKSLPRFLLRPVCQHICPFRRRFPPLAVTIRLDADVVEWFKGQGAGYQTRINQLLRQYMQVQQGHRR